MVNSKKLNLYAKMLIKRLRRQVAQVARVRNACCIRDYMYLLGVRTARNVTDFAVKSHRRALTTDGPVAVKLGARSGGRAGAKWICPVPRWPGADNTRDTTFEIFGCSPLLLLEEDTNGDPHRSPVPPPFDVILARSHGAA